jgi:hypothetical protein
LNVQAYNGISADDFVGLTEIRANELAAKHGIELCTSQTLFRSDDREKLDSKFVPGTENKLSVKYDTFHAILLTNGSIVRFTRHCRTCKCDGNFEVRVISEAAFGKYRAFNPDGSIDYT